MKKVLNVHDFSTNDGIYLRTLFTGGVYVPREHFRGTEVSDLLEWLLPNTATWMDYVTDNPEKVKDLVDKPYVYEGRPYRAVFAFWKSDWGRVVMVNDLTAEAIGFNQFDYLPRLGLHIEFNKVSEFIKAPKFLNRIMAPVQHLVTAREVVEQDEDRVIYRLANGELFSVKHVQLSTLNAEQTALVDGGAALSLPGVLKLGYPKQIAKLGFARRFWSTDVLGGAKGHAICVPWLEDYDMIVFGPKNYVKTDYFAFGDMGELHPGKSYTDVQSFCNFDWFQAHLGPKLADEHIADVKRALADEWAMRRLLLSHIQTEIEDLDAEDVINPNGFLLSYDVSRGISPVLFPGLRRRAFRYLTSQVMDMTRLRIPMANTKRTVGVRLYVTFDPYVIDERGDVIPERSRIPAGCIVAPGIASGTKVAVYRNPNGHPKEMVLLTTVWNDAYRRLKRSGLCLIGRGADKILKPLNGGDMDDSFNIIIDPEWVKAMSELPSYPAMEPEEMAGDPSPISDNRRKYGKAHIYMQIDDAYSKRIGIGPVVNMGIDDTIKSHPVHKDMMIRDLVNREKGDFADSLIARPDYQAAFHNSNLENIIDGRMVVGDDVSNYHKNQTVYPRFFTYTGRRLKRADGTWRTSRIPDSKKGYEVATSGVDVALDYIRRAIEELKAESLRLEWTMVRPADRDILDAFPRDKEVVKTVFGFKGQTQRILGLIELWRQEWVNAFARNLTDDERLDVYGAIDKKITEELKYMDANFRMEVAMEIYREVYKSYFNAPKVDAKGVARQFPDGLLWCKPIGWAFTAALESKGFTGRIVKVILNDAYRGETRGVVLVEAKDGIVYRKKDGAIIGTSSQLEDGNYLMDAGLIELKPAHPGLLPDMGE